MAIVSQRGAANYSAGDSRGLSLGSVAVSQPGGGEGLSEDDQRVEWKMAKRANVALPMDAADDHLCFR